MVDVLVDDNNAEKPNAVEVPNISKTPSKPADMGAK